MKTFKELTEIASGDVLPSSALQKRTVTHHAVSVRGKGVAQIPKRGKIRKMATRRGKTSTKKYRQQYKKSIKYNPDLTRAQKRIGRKVLMGEEFGYGERKKAKLEQKRIKHRVTYIPNIFSGHDDSPVVGSYINGGIIQHD